MHVELHGAVYRVTVGITVRYGGADVRDGDFQEGRCPAGGAGGGGKCPHILSQQQAGPHRRGAVHLLSSGGSGGRMWMEALSRTYDR